MVCKWSMGSLFGRAPFNVHTYYAYLSLNRTLTPQNVLLSVSFEQKNRFQYYVDDKDVHGLFSISMYISSSFLQ